MRNYGCYAVELDPETADGRKKLLVFINPFSGTGKALHLFQSRIIPILAEAGVHYETVVTSEYPNP